MKVVHLIGGGDVGGAKTHVLSLLNGLKRSIDVTLVSFREGPFAEEARAMGLDVRVISSVDPVKAYRALQKLILSEGFDLVHCHGARGKRSEWGASC
jgi:hypothetical protein